MVKHRGRRVALFENAVRLAKAFVDVAPRQVVFKQEVRAALLVENRRARSESFDGIEHRRQRLILDANFFQGPLRRAQILGHHHRNQFSLEADFIDSDKVLIVGEFEMLMGRQFEPRVLAVEMFPVQHCQHTRRFFSF